MVERCGVAQALRSAVSLAVDQSSVRRRLLGLADPAVLGVALGRHRLRCEASSARDDEHVREIARMVSRASATPRAGSRRKTPPAAGFLFPAQLLLRLQAGVFGGSLGAHRRGRGVSRSVLLARQRLHRDQQHLHHGSDRARPARRAALRSAHTCTSSCISPSTKAHCRCTPISTRCSAIPKCCR